VFYISPKYKKIACTVMITVLGVIILQGSVSLIKYELLDNKTSIQKIVEGIIILVSSIITAVNLQEER